MKKKKLKISEDGKLSRTSKEVIVANATSLPPAPPIINFEVALQQALSMFSDQALLTQDPDRISLESIELTKAKANSFLDSINNLLHVAHLNELIAADKMKFKRVDELAALNPLLQSFRLAAEASQRSVTFLVKEMDSIIIDLEKEGKESYMLGSWEEKGKKKQGKVERKRKRNRREEESYNGLGDDDDEDDSYEYEENVHANGKIHEAQGEELKNNLSARMFYISQALSNSIDNMNKIGAGLTRVIQLERYSGARGWGNMKSSPNQIGSIKGRQSGGDRDENLKEGGNGRRVLSADELRHAAEQADEDNYEED